MRQVYSSRRTSAQWQALVLQQRNSSLSAPSFCKQKNISYPSFCNWRRRCADTTIPVDNQAESRVSRPAVAEDDSPTFIDLGSLATAQTPATAAGWNITLRLGNGVELQLSQAQ